LPLEKSDFSQRAILRENPGPLRNLAIHHLFLSDIRKCLHSNSDIRIPRNGCGPAWGPASPPPGSWSA
jgi:hypothetical protein